MSSSGQVFVAALIGTPLAILVHELGHAVAGLRYTTKPVILRVGRSQLCVRLMVGRLTVLFSPFAVSSSHWEARPALLTFAAINALGIGR